MKRITSLLLAALLLFGTVICAYAAPEEEQFIITEVDSTEMVTLVSQTMLGDLDGDGRISSADALAALKISVGLLEPTQAQLSCIDVDGDKAITSADALMILKYSVGLIDKFTAEEAGDIEDPEDTIGLPSEFDKLSAAQQAAYNAIAEASENLTADYFPVPADITIQELSAAFSAYKKDNPEDFWALGSYSFMLGLTSAAMKLNYSVGSAAERNSMRSKVTAVFDEILRNVPNGASDYEKELYFHDRIIDICEYDYDTANDPNGGNEMSYTVYGAMVNKLAVCEGYAKSMKYLCKKAGIQCSLLTGLAGENYDSHMWNSVCLDGKIYHVDATFDDAGNDASTRHMYFNITDDMISYDHKDFPLQSANSLDDNYFNRNGNLYTEYNSKMTDEVSAKIIEGISKREEAITFAFTGKQAYNEFHRQMITNGDIFSIYYDANSKTSNKISDTTVSYSYISKFISIEIFYPKYID